MRGGTNRGRRRWQFGPAVFDETSWTLRVDGRPVSIEGRPLALLHVLLLKSGETVSKEELLERVWPGIFVAEASLTTAMRKLRAAIGDDSRTNRIVETVSGVGYRLAVPVECELVSLPSASETTEQDVGDNVAAIPPGRGPLWSKPAWRFAAGGAVGIAAVGLAFAVSTAPAVTRQVPVAAEISNRDVLAAIRRLDSDAIARFSKAGWDPNRPFDKQGNVPLGVAVEICEWNPDHDPQKLLMLVRTLYDAGAKVDVRNVYGDTPYSIAKADRFCGPEHPATKMMSIECLQGDNPLGDRCLATYEIARRDRNKIQDKKL